MKRKALGGIAITLFLAGSCTTDPYRPDRFLTAGEQAKLIRESVYYSAKLPPNSNQTTKFSKDFDWYYDRAVQETGLIKYYKAEDGNHYFLMTRKARSITPMREGIGGKLRYDAAGKLLEYDEVFRTWKMVSDSLNVRGAMLFDRMVKGKDLSIYYSKFQGDRYIEFPDDRFYFDKESRRWKDMAFDSLNIN